MSLLNTTGFVQTHDPVIVKIKGKYYRFQTGDRIPVAVSDDLLDWKFIGTVFPENPEWTSKEIPGSTHFWAPEVVQRNGKWRIYYSVSTFGVNTSAIGLAEFDPENLESGLNDLGPVIQSRPENNYNCIDPAVITDENGDDWLLFGSFWGGLQLVRLGTDGFILPGANLKNIASRKTEPNPIEGGYIIHAGKYYYLFASHDFCCRGTASTYHIVVGRSESVEGPYLDAFGTDMMESGGTTLRDGFSYERWAGPGHNTVFADDDGKFYLVYHAYDRTDEGKSKLQIEEINFDDDWPEFN